MERWIGQTPLSEAGRGTLAEIFAPMKVDDTSAYPFWVTDDRTHGISQLGDSKEMVLVT